MIELIVIGIVIVVSQVGSAYFIVHSMRKLPLPLLDPNSTLRLPQPVKEQPDGYELY